ncbi:Xaa-Pro peptidase family protein [Paracoccaceae bacterium]
MSVAPLTPAFRAMVRERLRTLAAAAGLDGLLLLAPGNVAYASGWLFSVNERPMGLWVPVNGDATLFVPHLELENALAVPGVRVVTYDEFPGHVPPELWMLAQTGRPAQTRRVGIDRLEARLLAAAQDICTLDLTDHCLTERSVKHPEELALIRAAAGYADLVLRRLLAAGGDIIAQGGTELDLMADCTGHARAALMRDHGAAFAGTKIGITASVHSGPRAALPHGTVIARRPQPGEPIIAGIGCSLGGCHAESGVTLVYGDISAEQHRIMTVMEASNVATRAALDARLSCEAVNEAALAPIRSAGFGAAIRHRIGHGMGVEGHEAPWLSPGDATTPAPGMVFSCEPGIYRPDLDGWRNIETFIVTEGRTETPSRFQSDHPIQTRVIPA